MTSDMPRHALKSIAVHLLYKGRHLLFQAMNEKTPILMPTGTQGDTHVKFDAMGLKQRPQGYRQSQKSRRCVFFSLLIPKEQSILLS